MQQGSSRLIIERGQTVRLTWGAEDALGRFFGSKMIAFDANAALAAGIRVPFRFAASRSPVPADPVRSLRHDP